MASLPGRSRIRNDAEYVLQLIKESERFGSRRLKQGKVKSRQDIASAVCRLSGKQTAQDRCHSSESNIDLRICLRGY